MGERAPSPLQRVGDIRSGKRRVLVEVRVKLRDPARQRRLRASRHHEQVGPPCGGPERHGQVLLQNDVNVGTSEAEGRHRRAPRGRSRLPRTRVGVNVEGAALEVDPGIGALEVRERRQRATGQDEARLDQAGDACGAAQVPDVGLDRSQRAIAGPVRVPAKDVGQRRDLDGIPEPRAGAVGFHVTEGLR